MNLAFLILRLLYYFLSVYRLIPYCYRMTILLFEFSRIAWRHGVHRTLPFFVLFPGKSPKEYEKIVSIYGGLVDAPFSTIHFVINGFSVVVANDGRNIIRVFDEDNNFLRSFEFSDHAIQYIKKETDSNERSIENRKPDES